MNYASIKFYDIANGEGVRTSLFVSGCTHHCKGCFNPETWDFRYGQPFTVDTLYDIVKSIEPEYIAGLTVLGGEPMEPENQKALLPLYRAVKDRFPKKELWCYTGYTFETDLLSPEGKVRTPVTEEILRLIDVLVDGEFIEAEKDVTLTFRGSRNQRVLRISADGEAATDYFV